MKNVHVEEVLLLSIFRVAPVQISCGGISGEAGLQILGPNAMKGFICDNQYLKQPGD